jgi:hypothetical protein
MRRQPHVSGQGPILLSAYPHSKMAAKEASSPRLFNRPDAGGSFLRGRAGNIRSDLAD